MDIVFSGLLGLLYVIGWAAVIFLGPPAVLMLCLSRVRRWQERKK